MVVVIGGQKGGVGKSSLAINISSCLAKKNKTIIVDADNQNSIIKFKNKHNVKNNKLDFISESGDLRKIIIFLKSKYANVIIDTAGRDCAELRSATTLADIFLIPFQTSEIDLLTANYISKAVLPKLKKVNNDIKTLAVFNNVATHYLNNEIHYATGYLQHFKNINLLNSCVKSRKSYRDSFKSGVSIFETKDKKAINEIKSITREIENV